MQQTLRIQGSLAIVILATAASALAQSAPEPTWLEFRTMTVRADCLSEWRETQQSAVSPALKKAGVPWREAWQTATFGTTRQYVFVTPIPDFAQYDQENRVQLSASEADLLARCNLDHRVQAVLLRRELSKMRDTSKPPKIAIVTVEQLAPGKREEWQELIQSEVLPAMRKASIPGYHVLQNVFGGPVEFATVEFLDSMADIDKGPTSRTVLGREAAAEIARRRRGLRTHTERSIVRYVAELSFSSVSNSSAGSNP